MPTLQLSFSLHYLFLLAWLRWSYFGLKHLANRINSFQLLLVMQLNASSQASRWSRFIFLNVSAYKRPPESFSIIVFTAGVSSRSSEFPYWRRSQAKSLHGRLFIKLNSRLLIWISPLNLRTSNPTDTSASCRSFPWNRDAIVCRVNCGALTALTSHERQILLKCTRVQWTKKMQKTVQYSLILSLCVKVCVCVLDMVRNACISLCLFGCLVVDFKILFYIIESYTTELKSCKCSYAVKVTQLNFYL